jgi:hypothetical protein
MQTPEDLAHDAAVFASLQPASRPSVRFNRGAGKGDAVPYQLTPKGWVAAKSARPIVLPPAR